MTNLQNKKNAEAQLNLGVMYLQGEGVLQDYTKGAYWTKKAYDNPNASNKTKNNASDNWKSSKLWKY